MWREPRERIAKVEALRPVSARFPSPDSAISIVCGAISESGSRCVRREICQPLHTQIICKYPKPSNPTLCSKLASECWSARAKLGQGIPTSWPRGGDCCLLTANAVSEDSGATPRSTPELLCDHRQSKDGYSSGRPLISRRDGSARSGQAAYFSMQ
jgi:hypothetical protein